MASKEELLAEAYKRGLLPPEKRAAYEELQRRQKPQKGFWEQRADDLLAPAKGAIETIKSATAPKPAPRPVQKPGNFGSELMARLPRSPQEYVGGLVDELKDDVKLGGGLAALVASPFTGLTDVALRPIARAGERAGIGTEDENMGSFNKALMGSRPAPGRAPRPVQRRGPTTPEAAALAKKAKPDTAAMRARAKEFEAVGIKPALVDVMDDSGRGVVRATASRMTPARQKATDFRDARALDLPDRIGAQARRVVSSDARTPDQIRADLSAQRKTAADQAFGQVRDTRLPLDENTVSALRSPDGKDAIRQAAKDAMNSLDPAERNLAAELNALADAALDAPGQTEISVGMAQSISKSLLDAAEAATRNGKGNSGRILGNLGRAIRGNAETAVPGYGDALKGYAADSRMIEAAEVGEGFMARNTDEFSGLLSGMSDPERLIARAAARRSIERQAGENVSAAPAVARRIATAPEQMRRNEALLGPQDAQGLQAAMSLEERALRNANDIAPRTGSQTANKLEDNAELAKGVVRGVVQIGRGRWVDFAMDRLKSAGISDEMAQSITELAIDPTRTQDAINAMESALGPTQTQMILKSLADPLVLAPANTAAQGVRRPVQVQ